MEALIRLAADDNVGVAIRDLAAGTEVEVDGLRLVAQDAIPFGHKMALRPLQPGEKVIKFGVPVGSATRAIEPGMHVHVHNIQSDYVNNQVDNYES
jgi:hypothetical protein